MRAKGEKGCRRHNGSPPASPSLCLSVTGRQHGPGSCVFPHKFLVNVIKALTPSCLAPALVLCLLKTRWLFLSSSLSKLNNHEEENITCGKSTPFSFASYYPNSSLILYHCYPPTNDRVQAILSLTTSLPKTHNRSCYASPASSPLHLCLRCSRCKALLGGGRGVDVVHLPLDQV